MGWLEYILNKVLEEKYRSILESTTNNINNQY